MNTEHIEPLLIDCGLNIDDRGYVHCVLDNMGSKSIQRAYIVENHSKGMLRAWHGHLDGTTYIHVISGSAKIGAVSIVELKEYQRRLGGRHIISEPKISLYTLSTRKPQVVYIPGGFFNAHMSLEDNTKLLIFSSLSFAEVKEDDERLPASLLRSIWEVKAR